ncbi:TRIO and F-actin-binding protein [Crotalus adamanteus]|uniref:TRIO and F-actin-binding protein n=2 Tax=Crotalus adamanteus TaxID=8729 RepID=A0AAW1BDT1_CROAD
MEKRDSKDAITTAKIKKIPFMRCGVKTGVRSRSCLLKTMSEPADYILCEKFEANMFAKNRCQNCLRTITAHQHGNQGFKKDAINLPNCIASTSEFDPADPWDPLCILASQCKVYVYVGSEDRSESRQESLDHTQLNCSNEESEAANTCPDASNILSTDADSNATLSEDQEMTRLLSNILESEKENSLHLASLKKKVQSENLHPDWHRWAEATSCRRTVSWSCLKPESRAMSQDCGDSRRKHQAESGYFSLECCKSESNWISSTSCPNHSMLPASINATGASRWTTSSLSLGDSELNWHKSRSSEDRCGLIRQNYTILADLPKAKRLHQDTFEKDHSRAHSPGRAEVERIFGQERRKSETLEVFQALEEGLLERLDSKSLKLAKEGRLVRRRSSPTLCREVKKRFPWEPEHSRTRESLCIGRSEQQLKISSQSHGQQQLVDNRKNQGAPVKWAEDEWINWQRSPSPSTAEKHLGNNKEKLFYQKQQGEGHSACSSRSQILYLGSNKKHKAQPGAGSVSGKGLRGASRRTLPAPCSLAALVPRARLHHWLLLLWVTLASLGEADTKTSQETRQPFALDGSMTPDLLNFKKGWMSILGEPGEWTKHWFVLTDSSLRYYRDSNAEEADDLDGEIDLRTCTDVTEYAVQRNYGFQIHTKDCVFTLSAMTSGIRRNWIEALRKSIRPASVPDVTKLSEHNKENSFRNNKSPKSSFPTELQPNTGSEVISRAGSRKAEGQQQAFDYVELSPLQQRSALNQGSPQRSRGSTRSSDGAVKREELERDLALRSEERRKWFESSVSGGLQTDGPVENPCLKKPHGTPLTEVQRSRLSEDIEKKWQELERLPLKESRRVPLMVLLNQGKGNPEDASEALEKEVQVLRSQLDSLRSHNEANLHKNGHMPQGYISQEACERSFAEMENSHQQVMTELQRHHQWEMERLRQEKERLLSEEAAATAAAIEALKKAHREEMNKELGRTRNFQKGFSDPNALQQQHRSDVESLKRELQVLSEQYSQKCLEIEGLVDKAEEQEQMLQRCQQEGKELLRQNQELQRRLSEEIGQLRDFIAARGSRDGSSHNDKSSCELEVLLRVKENELQYQKQEVQCLRDELQMMQKDKKFASGKYHDIYLELNHIKQRSEREIEHLKEHLRLAMAALEEKEMLHNNIG